MRSGAKWFEEGERNSYCFSLERRNYVSNSILSLKINERLSSDISSCVYSFYEKLYASQCDDVVVCSSYSK